MENENPYAPPTARLEDPQEPPQAGPDLATRGSRLGASLIDGSLGSVFGVTLGWYLGVFDGFPYLKPATFSQQILLLAGGILVFVALHGYLLATAGQTIGKRLVRIRIARPDGERPSLSRLLGLRYAPLWIAAGIPGVGQVYGLLDALFIFSKDRRCIHDRIADTVVVRSA